jgi:phosphoserine aminotransferase
MGGEAAHGMLILSPRAIERLETHTPPWPLPKIFRLTKGGKFMKEVFDGETLNTPSMLCVEDYLDALVWAESVGGLKALCARADANARVLYDWAERRPWLECLAVDPATRSNTSVCLRIVDPPYRGCRSRRSAPSSSSSRPCSTRRTPPATLPAIATPRRACASGAARRWRRPTSRR